MFFLVYFCIDFLIKTFVLKKFYCLSPDCRLISGRFGEGHALQVRKSISSVPNFS